MNKKAFTTQLVLTILITIALIVIISIGAYYSPEIKQLFFDSSHNSDYINYPDIINLDNITHNILPDRNLAPGDILTNNLSIICHTGYSSEVRDVSQSLREEVFARDNVPYPQPKGTTELDHIVPLCGGGSNSEDNLFVQFSDDIVGEGKGYESKDRLENYLRDKVCSGEIDIDYAQKRIAEDWYLYYREVYG